MMLSHTVLWGAVGFASVWVALFVAVGLRASKGLRTIDQFLIYGKDMTRSELRWTFYATNISLASIFVAIAATARVSGLSALWLIVAWVVGMWVFFRFYRSRTIQEFFVSRRGRTMYEFMGDAYGSRVVRQIGGMLAIVVYVGSVGAEFYAFVEILRYLAMPDRFVLPLCILLTILTVVYSTFGGFRSVVRTEIWQFAATVIGSIAIAVIVVFGFVEAIKSGALGRAPLCTDAPFFGAQGVFSDLDLIVGSFILFLPFMLSSMDAWQRCAAISEHEDAVAWMKTVIKQGSFVFPLIYGLPVACGVLYAVLVPAAEPASDTAPLLRPLIETIGRWPLAMQLIVFAPAFAGFVAAMISTADTLLVSAVYALYYDVKGVSRLQRTRLDRPAKPKTDALLIRDARVWLVVFGLLSVIVTIIGSYQVGVPVFIWALFSSLIIFAVPLLMAVWFPRFVSGRFMSAVTSMLLGFGSVFALMGSAAMAGPSELAETGPLAPLVGFIVALGGYCIVLPFRARKANEGGGK